jgi:hypothetical protein
MTCIRKVDRGMKICELVKGYDRYTIKAPLGQLKELELRLRILP